MLQSDLHEQLAKVPLQEPDPATWPKHVRPISVDDMGAMGVDASGILYWHGKPIELVQRVQLRQVELWLLAVAAAGTALQGVAAIFPFIPAWVTRLIVG